MLPFFMPRILFRITNIGVGAMYLGVGGQIGTYGIYTQGVPMELQQEMDQISEPDQEEVNKPSCKLYKFYNKWYLRVPQSKKCRLSRPSWYYYGRTRDG